MGTGVRFLRLGRDAHDGHRPTALGARPHQVAIRALVVDLKAVADRLAQTVENHQAVHLRLPHFHA